MAEVPVRVNGLPLIAVVHTSYDAYTGESDAEVQALYWRKRDGSRGKHVSTKIWDRIEGSTWGLVFDQMMYEQYIWDCATKAAPLLYQGGVQDNETIDGLFRFD